MFTILLVNMLSIYTFSQEQDVRNADCTIVLGAGVKNGEPSPVFQERLNHSVYLYQKGYVGIIILTGGYSIGSHVSDAKIAKRYLLAKGIPEMNIFLEEQSTVTRENLSYAKDVMNLHQLHNALIISDPLHMKRAILIAKDNDIKAWSSPTPTSLYKSQYARFSFLVRESIYYSGYLILRLFH
ncbi:YdcF family protein [Hafnia paralvei]|uniref:YdcF family protein n=1 Tax=Hafnia paralvei TaxID=546367 RepID=UPI002671AB28|nr:YdcF family protein [Hafnia paralvei]